ncbi:tetratricopeptide repeat protein [Desulfovibrio sp. JC010]|uniref:tetratricopeptide repeat protein n=1 Tax=Desulfovibrio sp. JC010 TaxID=2593641 RepID=UPI0013D4759A|nr:tetratricopeptide repeat protein [Desulfovibrio sp. JC010]NDV27099.1 tetratricopeptide repeat protein [Desulfovibrio sp. JC010]
MYPDRFQELEKVVDYLENADSGFVIVEVNDRRSQNNCVSFLETELISKKIVSIDLEYMPDDFRPANFIESAVKDFSEAKVFCVLNMSGLAKGDREEEIRMLRSFNMAREKLDNLDKLLVFFFPSYFVDLILRYALDFYDFASLRIKIPNPERPFMDRGEYEPEFADEKYLSNRVEFLKSRLGLGLDDEERFKVLMDLGDCLGKLYRWDEAIEVFEGAVGLAEEMGESNNKLKALYDMSEMAFLDYDYSLAASISEQGLDIALESDQDDADFVAAFLTTLARVERKIGETERAESLFKEAYLKWQAIGGNRECAIILGEMARILSDKGQDDDALRLHERQIEEFLKINDTRERAVTLGDIARIYKNKNRIDEALQVHEERLSIFDSLGESISSAGVRRDIGRILTEKGMVDEALRIHKEQLKFYEKIGDLQNCAITLFDIAQIVFYQKGSDALPFLEKAFGIVNDSGDRDGKAFVGRLLGEVLCYSGRYEDGLPLLHEALKNFKELMNYSEAEETNMLISEMEAYAAANPLPEENNDKDSK